MEINLKPFLSMYTVLLFGCPDVAELFTDESFSSLEYKACVCKTFSHS